MRNRSILVAAVSFFFVRGLLAVSGPPPDENPEGNTGALKTRIETGCGYDAHSGNASRGPVTDLHVSNAPGVYGLDFTRYWNSIPPDEELAQAVWPVDFGFSSWSHSWGWSAIRSGHDEQQLDGGPEMYVTTMGITFPDGHTTVYKIARAGLNAHYGPPYSAGEADWGPPPSEGVHDYLGRMAPDGSEFWLYLADGGSIHFTGGDTAYRPIEVFDPHGLRTDLIYDAYGRLHEVRQEGGRSLFITWAQLSGFNPSVITKVETGGSMGSQRVTYQYKKIGLHYVLATVAYPDDPAPGQTTSAVYVYSMSYDGTNTLPSGFPILRMADDPRFAGPMTKILYYYRGYTNGCHRYTPFPPNEFLAAGYWGAKRDYLRPEAEAILMEASGETGTPVSSFQIGCFNGTRTETNGLNGWRTFYFGRSSHDVTEPRIKGYQLAKLTDFTHEYPLPPDLPFVHQNYNVGHPWKVWDGRGQPTELVYTDGSGLPGRSGLPNEIHHPDQSVEWCNRVDSSGSDPRDETRIPNPNNHWLFWKKNERGQTTYYRRDARRRVKQIDYPDGANSEYFTYNDLNQVETHTLPSGAVQHYVYNGLHQLSQEWNSVDGESAYTEYTYDTLDRVATVQNPRARVNGKPFSAKMTYNGRHQILSVEYPGTGGSANPTVTYQYDKYGNCITITDELGNRKEYTYDAYRRCTSYLEWLMAPAWNGSGTVTTRRWDWFYDRLVDGLTVEPLRGASSHTSREWRIQIEPVFNENGERRATSRTFDVNNRITSEQTGQIQVSTEPLGTLHSVSDTETHYFTYDANGQKSSYKDPRERLTTYEYDNRNRLWKTNETVNTIPRTTETLYDTTGNKTLVRFPDQTTQQWLYHDAFGQPRQYIDERGNVTDLSYWPWGPMKKLGTVTTHRRNDNDDWEHQETRFYYDLMGRPQQTFFPDNTHEYTGYEFGQVKVWETRKHQTKTIVYDARGREQSHTWSDGTPGVTRVWDDANRLSRIANFFSAIDYQYDNAGQVWWERNTITDSGGAPQTTYYRYPSGEVSRVTYPNGSAVVNRNYTARGQLQNTSWTGGNVNYAYLPDGKVDYEDYGNGVRSDLDYDGRGFINLSKTYRLSGGQTYAKRDYWRDERDRIKGWKKGYDVSANPMENGRGDRYDYDDEGQLFRASYQLEDPDTNPRNALRTDFFHYDALGNRFRWNDVASRGAMDFKRRDNKLNQYESWENSYQPPQHWGSAIYYDDNFQFPSPPWIPPGNGVTMADGWITASYNALNQPMAMGNIGYGGKFMWFWFDPLGRCVKRWMGTGNGTPVGSNPITYFYYDGWNLIQEGSTATSTDRVYVHGNRVDEIVASWSAADGNWLYHHYDARGHCILQTNASGGLQEQYDYDAFGWPYFYTATGAPARVNGKPGSPSGNRFLFTGREFLSGLRIYDFRNRMYQPELGRFLQPDPKQFDAGDYNLYRYCHNDPVNRSDPMGLADDVTIEFVPAVGHMFLQIQPDRVVDRASPGSDAVSLMAPNGGLRTAATTDKTTGDIHVTQRIKIETWIKESQDKQGKTPELRQKELLRVDKFREGVPEAQRKADALAAKGFKDEASAIQSVEKSTKDQMLKQALEGKLKWDLPGGKH